MKNFTMNMPVDQMQRIMHKMYHKRNILLRAFAVNLALIFVAWLLVAQGAFSAEWMGRMMMCAPDEAEREALGLIGLWKIGGVLFFLAPALAIWWEMRCCKKLV